MSDADDEIEATERALAAERQRLRELGERADASARPIGQCQASEGGIVFLSRRRRLDSSARFSQ
jgi:hypothetical protein